MTTTAISRISDESTGWDIPSEVEGGNSVDFATEITTLLPSREERLPQTAADAHPVRDLREASLLRTIALLRQNLVKERRAKQKALRQKAA